MTKSRLDLPKRSAVVTVCALLVPFAAMAAFLAVSRAHVGWTNATGDYLALAISVGLGLGCLWRLPVSRLWRLAATVPYAAVVCLGLVFFSLTFVCAIYDDCI